jgi:ribosomal protein S18 acetylase RimI-like enzyme
MSANSRLWTLHDLRIEALSETNVSEAVGILRECLLLAVSDPVDTIPEASRSDAIEDECRDIESVYRSPDHFLVARTQDGVVGCVGIKVRPAKSAEMSRLYVRPPYRGRGIGSQLVSQAERIALRSGVTRITIKVAARRANAIAWHRRLGYYQLPAGEAAIAPMVLLAKTRL